MTNVHHLEAHAAHILAQSKSQPDWDKRLAMRCAHAELRLGELLLEKEAAKKKATK